MTENPWSKELLREELKSVRASLSPERREMAARSLFHALSEELSSFKSILSFVSLKGEIDTTQLNLFLANREGLLLPRVSGNTLEVLRVNDLSSQLLSGPFGLLEPDPNRCERVSSHEIGAILVPGLGFDRQNHRLGYGFGYYDRFLRHCVEIPTFGLGFTEQKLEILPKERHDIPLKSVHLF